MAPDWTKKLLSGLFAVEAAFTITAFVVIDFLLIFDVTLREVAGTSVHGAQRISVYAMILIGFLGIGLASAQGRHLRPRFADGLVPDRLTLFGTRLGDAVMAMAWLVFAWLGLRFVREAREFQDMARVIDIPLWPLYLVVPYAFASTALRHALFARYPALRPKEIAHE